LAIQEAAEALFVVMQNLVSGEPIGEVAQSACRGEDVLNITAAWQDR
jgi:hypothetical protein